MIILKHLLIVLLGIPFIILACEDDEIKTIVIPSSNDAVFALQLLSVLQSEIERFEFAVIDGENILCHPDKTAKVIFSQTNKESQVHTIEYQNHQIASAGHQNMIINGSISVENFWDNIRGLVGTSITGLMDYTDFFPVHCSYAMEYAILESAIIEIQGHIDINDYEFQMSGTLQEPVAVRQ